MILMPEVEGPFHGDWCRLPGRQRLMKLVGPAESHPLDFDVVIVEPEGNRFRRVKTCRAIHQVFPFRRVRHLGSVDQICLTAPVRLEAGQIKKIIEIVGRPESEAPDGDGTTAPARLSPLPKTGDILPRQHQGPEGG